MSLEVRILNEPLLPAADAVLFGEQDPDQRSEPGTNATKLFIVDFTLWRR
jgi:hypothetical protein